MVGGEAVTADLVRRSMKKLPAHVRFGNLYGSTETIVNASWYEVVEKPSSEEKYTPIGWARAGTQIHLLDINDGIGEIGVSGNIAVKVARVVATSYYKFGHCCYWVSDVARRQGWPRL